MKLVIQIPCWNEAATLGETIRALPRQLAGIDCIEVLIIDDGSGDDTVSQAREHGAHHIVRLPQHRGLAEAFSAGIDAALRIGADIIVNTDADHQYPGSEIANLIAPILQRRADLVIGDRQTDNLAEFGATKRWLQRWGSRVTRRLSGTDVADSPSGFRAMSRECALGLFVHNRFSYTLETIIAAGQQGRTLANVAIRTNPTRRPSRLFRSIPEYLGRAGPVLLRSYAMYRPVQLVGLLIVILGLVGAVTALRFLYHYFENPSYSGYTQSLVIGMAALVIAVLLGVTALLAELIAANRRLLEDLRARIRRLELDRSLSKTELLRLGIETTDAAAWTGRDRGMAAGAPHDGPDPRATAEGQSARDPRATAEGQSARDPRATAETGWLQGDSGATGDGDR